MNIKKFKATVTVEKEIEIEVNTDILNEQFLKEFSEGMWEADSLSDIVEHVAFSASVAEDGFIEGIGEYPRSTKREENLSKIGVHIKYNDLDDDIEVSVQEIK